jgi:hypothetical protein
MTILFGSLGDGRTMRAFGAVAGFASLGAIAFGGEAERYAQLHRAGFSLMSISKPEVGGPPQPHLNGVDYATTGSFEPEGRRELVVLGRCNDILGQH